MPFTARSRRQRNVARAQAATPPVLDAMLTQPASPAQSEPTRDRFGDLMLTVGFLGLAGATTIGMWLSFETLRTFAEPFFGERYAWAFPLTVDVVILSCTARFVGLVRRGRLVQGYRVVAWLGIVATVLFNTLAADGFKGALMHSWSPLIAGLLIELGGKEAMGHAIAVKARELADATRVPMVLWVMAPVTTMRVRVHMARTAAESFVGARGEVAVIRAARHALRTAITGDQAATTRRVIMRHIRDGVLAPAVVVAAADAHRGDATAVMRAVNEAVLSGKAAARVATDAAPVTRARTAPRPPARTEPARAQPRAAEPPARAAEVFDQDDAAASPMDRYARGELTETTAYAAWARAQDTGRAWTGREIGHVLDKHEGTGRRLIQRDKDTNEPVGEWVVRYASERAAATIVAEQAAVAPARPELVDHAADRPELVDLRRGA